MVLDTTWRHLLLQNSSIQLSSELFELQGEAVLHSSLSCSVHVHLHVVSNVGADRAGQIDRQT